MEDSSNTSNKSSISNIEENKLEMELSNFEKIMQLNKLGSLFLAADKFEKALSIFKKTFDFYNDKKSKNEIPNFFYSNLYCNLGKAYSCLKDFKNAEEIYKECILNNTIYKILIREKEFLKENFLIDVDNLLIIENLNPEHRHVIENKFEIMINYFDNNIESLSNNKLTLREEFNIKILKRFKPNNLNSLSSFTDSLVNLAVIFQYFYKESITSFNMYFLAILLEPDNTVANVDFNNFLRENDLKEKSDEYIIQRVIHDCLKEKLEETENQQTALEIKLKQINAKNSNSLKNFEKINSNEKSFSFVCMKWGTKYNADYVN